MHDFVIVSDFNASNLAALFSKTGGNGHVRARCAAFNQVIQCMLSPDDETWPKEANGAIIWSTPQGISQAYRRRLEYAAASIDEMLDEVRVFGDALGRLPGHLRHIFVPTWSAFHPLFTRRGLLDMDPDCGLSLSLMTMNLLLHEIVSEDSRIHLFDSSRWTALNGEKCYDPRLWYASKTPYSLGVFREAARDFSSALRALEGGARKLLVVDLDDTLWGGTIGDDGWQNLRLGGHDAVGEAYRDFQAALLALIRRGILLAIASKNDEHLAMEAIASHPEMLLHADDFAGWRINWNDKAQNLVELAEELNLGLEAIVFVDDNPAERDRIRHALPAVFVPDWPGNPAYYCSALATLDCFDAPLVGFEDRNRTSMYVAERKRKLLRHDSLADWLRGLGLHMEVEGLSEANQARAIQLLNKTNQMNLTTRRLSASEYIEWAKEPNRLVLAFKLSDKLGDYGLVGIGSFEMSPCRTIARIADLVLSCRVFGRQVEESILWVLESVARAGGATQLVAEYQPTTKNGPCLRFLEKNLRRVADTNRFVSDLATERPLPDCITLIWDMAAQTAQICHIATESRS